MMTLHALSIENALLTGKWDISDLEIQDEPLAKLARQTIDGAFRQVLTSPFAREVLTVVAASGDLKQPFDQLLRLSASQGRDQLPDELLRIILAAACLRAFVQANWTGPDLDVAPLDVLVLPGTVTPPPTEAHLNQKAIAELAYHGEPAYHLTQHATFLRVAQLLLDYNYVQCLSAAWWRLRAISLHLHILDEPVPVPPDVLASVQRLTALPYSSDPELLGRLYIEQGLLEHWLSHNKLAAEHFVRAAKSTGLEYELTGALGKRTKFQENDISQLVLLAESRLKLQSSTPGGAQSTGKDGAHQEAPVPETLSLGDDTLLERTQFTSSSPDLPSSSRFAHLDPSSQPPLHPIDQCILLSLCLNIKNRSPADGLTSEQMAPYIERVISHPKNWSVHTMALLLRSRLESARTRTVERATLQLQALIDQMPTADSTVTERLAYFHSTPLPSKWEMEKELAERLLSLGVVKSALEIFERLEMWEEVVKCWQALDRNDKATAIVLDLLEGRKEEHEAVVSRGKTKMSPQKKLTFDAARESKLWCLLGDLDSENAAKHYERAWRVSKETSGRAMRSLGGYYFARGQYDEAITSLRRAVAINPLLSRSWFVLGCAYARRENWEGGREAFTRCVAIDDEDAESWNNLASIYLRLGEAGKVVGGDSTFDSGTSAADEEEGASSSRSVAFSNKLLAFHALKHGLRNSYDNWRMWSNYMVVAMDVGEFSEACRALARVVEETSAKVGAQCVDEDVLDRLVSVVMSASLDGGDGNTSLPEESRNPHEGRQTLLPRVLDLLERVILPRVTSPRIFRAYGRLLSWQSRWEDAIKAYLDGYRCSSNSGDRGASVADGGYEDVETWRQAVCDVVDAVDVLRNFGPRVDGYKWQFQGRSIVRTFMARTKEFQGEPEWQRLTDMLQECR